MTEPPAALSCSGLRVGYGSRIVLDGISVSFPAAVWSAVVGPNGCGKSTLLRTLAGLARPRSGAVLLQGRPMVSWPRLERARRLSWLAQSASGTDLTAGQVVGLGRFAHGGWLGARQGVDDAAIRRAMMATGSSAWHDRRVSSLSGGERQRVYLARALAAEAGVLLLDEPTTYLDPPHQQDVMRLLRREAQSGICVVSAIHDLSLALAADRLVVMGPGGLVGQGTVREALAGDWLSVAFDTPIEVVESEGAYLWRPALGGG